LSFKKVGDEVLSVFSALLRDLSMNGMVLVTSKILSTLIVGTA